MTSILRSNRVVGRSCLWTLVALFLIIGVSTAAWAQTYEVIRPVNLREGPGKEHPVLRVLESTEKVEKLGSQAEYFQVRTEKGEEGYV